MKQKSIVIILTAGILLSVGALYVHSSGVNVPQQEASPKIESRLIKDINSDYMYQTIELLSKQPREAGTEGEFRSVQYLEKVFKNLGYKTELQKFPIYNYKTNHVSVEVRNQEIEETPVPFSGDARGKIRAQLVYSGKAQGWEVHDVKGKLALVERGDLPFVDKVKNLLNKGAVGVIMFNNESSGAFTGQLPENIRFPAVGISRDKGLALVEKLKKKPVEVTLEVNLEKIETTSYNVIASRKPAKKNDTGQIVTIGAHHDSVPGGPGANDDASGVAAVLELARVFSKMPIDTEVRFLTFGSEERGLVGSTYYTKHLHEKEIKQMVGHFQMDMIGASAAGGNHPAGGLIMYTMDGKKNLVTDLAAAAGKRVLSEVIPYGKEGRSDHQPFHERGIPAALFIDAPVEPDYHKPTDTLDKISKEKLSQAARVVGAAVYQIIGQASPAVEKSKAVSATVDYSYENRNLD